MALAWGIDLGGTKIEGVVAEADKLLQPHARLRIDTEAAKGYDHILSQIKRLVDQLSAKVSAAPHVMGFSTPGTTEPSSGLMKNCNTTCLNGRPLAQDLEKLLQFPCHLQNDANCFALAETLYGAGRGAKVAFGVILGTGVGGGVVVDGKAWGGLQGIAGEWGHNQIDPDGEDCYCGKKGCLELLISGPALERRYQRLSGERRSLIEIAERARQKEKAAQETIRFLIETFGKAITTIINILDPEVIILGGGVSNVAELYTDTLPVVKKYIFNSKVETPIRKHELGDSAGVFGAAMLGRYAG